MKKHTIFIFRWGVCNAATTDRKKWDNKYLGLIYLNCDFPQQLPKFRLRFKKCSVTPDNIVSSTSKTSVFLCLWKKNMTLHF